MQPPHRWRFYDDLGEIDAWIDRCGPSEVQLMQFYDWVGSTLCVNPLPFLRAKSDRTAEEEHTATIPGTNIVVSFVLLYEDRKILLSKVETVRP